jgi:hypothetical protein
MADAIAASKQWSDVYEKLGVGNLQGGSMHSVLRKRLQESKIDISHLIRGKGWAKGHTGLSPKNKIPTEAILVQQCRYSHQLLKKRVRDEKLIPYLCESCGIGPIWNGKPMVLTLDHRNGVHDDNRLSNLRFMCWNCHSQTETFAGKKRRDILK